MKIISLFDGISCGMVALERAGIPVERYVAYEIEPNAIKISQKNYPQIEHCGNVFDADFTKYKGFDLLIGGSPCNHWSIANCRRETTPDGEGGRLFMAYVKALKQSGCKFFLYENNANITKEIKNFITEQLGVKPIMINSSLVSAQDRKRTYWTNIPNVKQPEDKGVLLADVIGKNCVCVAEQPYKRKKINGVYDRRYEPRKDGKSGTVVATREGQLNMLMVEADETVANCKVVGGVFCNSKKEYPIDLQDGNYIVRSFTVAEREKLQTLPVGYTSCVLESAAKKCVGNGWTVDVIAHILTNLKGDR